MLQEYDISHNLVTLYCDNMSAIDMSKSLVQHSRAKHIDIRHHFIRELIEDRIITLEHVCSNLQLANIFTKLSYANLFEHLRTGLRVCKM